MTTIIGTSDRSASTTAGWKFTAAVPLVESEDRRHATEPEPEGDERRRPFVVHDVHGDSPVLGEGERDRRVPRAGRHDAVAHAPGHPLVDEGGAERRLRAHLAHLTHG